MGLHGGAGAKQDGDKGRAPQRCQHHGVDAAPLNDVKTIGSPMIPAKPDNPGNDTTQNIALS